jgi:hypothetical protein
VEPFAVFVFVASFLADNPVEVRILAVENLAGVSSAAFPAEILAEVILVGILVVEVVVEMLVAFRDRQVI